MKSQETYYATTIVCVRKNDAVSIAADGQVTLGNTIFKHSANKLRTFDEGRVLVGFAGATADAFILFEKLEQKFKDNTQINLKQALVELTKNWRAETYSRKFEAMLIVADINASFILSGLGDIIDPCRNVCAIGSGGNFAISAGEALLEHSNLSSQDIAEKSLKIAADMCIYTNDKISSLTINKDTASKVIEKNK